MKSVTEYASVLASASIALVAIASCSTPVPTKSSPDVTRVRTADLESYGEALAMTTTTSTTEAPVVTTEPPTTAPTPTYAPTATSTLQVRSSAATFSAAVSTTAYCQSGTMADGNQTHSGAAASNRWRFGTRISVPGWGVVTIEDRIGSGSDLDLFASSCSQATQWGRRELTVEVLN